MNWIRKLYLTSPQQWFRGLQSVLFFRAKQSSILHGSSPGDQPRPAILDKHHFADEARLIKELLGRVERKMGFDDVIRGFDGHRYTERVVEIPAFAEWLLSAPDRRNLLDVGCVLNREEISALIQSRCSSFWFCNPIIEREIAYQGPVYYHRSALEDAFPGGETFDLITCLSTIEHIGFDNSQYGSTVEPRYCEPSIEPLLAACRRLAQLMKSDGRILLSVPFGQSEAIVHPVTNRVAMQVFDFMAMQEAIRSLRDASVDATLKVFKAEDNGWRESDPQDASCRYADGVPAASGVAFISGAKVL